MPFEPLELCRVCIQPATTHWGNIPFCAEHAPREKEKPTFEAGDRVRLKNGGAKARIISSQYWSTRQAIQHILYLLEWEGSVKQTSYTEHEMEVLFEKAVQII